MQLAQAVSGLFKFESLGLEQSRGIVPSSLWSAVQLIHDGNHRKSLMCRCAFFSLVLIATMPSVRGGCAIQPDAHGHVNYPPGETSIGDGAFYSCSSLVSITLPDSLKIIGMEAFSKCSNLGLVYVPSGCTIGLHAFRGAGGYTRRFAPFPPPPLSLLALVTMSIFASSSYAVTIVLPLPCSAFAGHQRLFHLDRPDSLPLPFLSTFLSSSSFPWSLFAPSSGFMGT